MRHGEVKAAGFAALGEHTTPSRGGALALLAESVKMATPSRAATDAARLHPGRKEAMSQDDQRRDEKTPEYLPVDSPTFLRKFIRQHFETLCREARRTCYQYNCPDYADDAISITIEKFMTSRIENRGPRSAIGFAVRILKNTCIDEARRRGRHAIPAGALMSDDDDGDFIQERVAQQDNASNPEAQLIADGELRAVELGFELLPNFMKKTHKNVERDLDIVRKRYLLRMSWEEIAASMGVAKAHRQSAARGRELLRGWVHALCETQPEPDAANRKYWQRGHEAGQLYRTKLGCWPFSDNRTDEPLGE